VTAGLPLTPRRETALNPLAPTSSKRDVSRFSDARYQRVEIYRQNQQAGQKPDRMEQDRGKQWNKKDCGEGHSCAPAA
jgi:hypothetical protein